MTREPKRKSSRRTFLKAVGTAGSSFVGASGVAVAQNDIEVIAFTGYIPAWYGIRPKSIAGKLNPTLELEAGQRYELRWTNGDGVGHDFIIRDQNGKWIAGTPLAFGTGSTESFRFTATEEMVSYFCTVHPVQMQGNITVSGQTDEGPNTKLPDDVSPVNENSSVTFKAQTFKGSTVTVESTTLPEGGFVAMHSPRLKQRPKTVRDVKKSIVGWSDYLEPGTHKNVTVPLEGRGAEYNANKYKKLIAMNHRDTNGNKNYDFFTKGPRFADADWPYFTPKGRPVVDSAKVKSKGGGQ